MGFRGSDMLYFPFLSCMFLLVYIVYLVKILCICPAGASPGFLILFILSCSDQTEPSSQESWWLDPIPSSGWIKQHAQMGTNGCLVASMRRRARKTPEMHKDCEMALPWHLTKEGEVLVHYLELSWSKAGQKRWFLPWLDWTAAISVDLPRTEGKPTLELFKLHLAAQVLPIQV